MNIFLRPVNIKDSNLIVKWRNADSVREHCFTKALITEDSNLKFYYDNVETGKYKQYIIERVNEDTGVVAYPIATVYLKDIDTENKRCELCIFTSDDREWDANGQIIAIRQLVEKAFSEYGLHKIYSFVFIKYEKEIDLLKDAGFSIEATLKREALNLNGEYEDVVRMCIFNETRK